MPELDGQIPASVKTPHVDPLATATAATELKNKLISADAAAQQYRARQAIGPIYQQSIDPKTGQLDANKLLSAVSANPDTAWMAGDIVAAAQAREKEQLGIDSSRVELVLKQTQNLRSRLGAMLADPNTTPEHAVKLAADLVEEGLLSQDQALTELRSMPKDPQGFRQWLTNHFISTLDNEQKLQTIAGQIVQQDTGGAINTTRINPLTGRAEVIAVTPKTLSPSEATSPVQVFNPETRQMENITREEFARSRGAGGGQGGSGRTGGAPAGPPLGSGAAFDVAGKASAEQAVALQQAADQAPARKAALQSMRDQLASFNSGPAADAVARIGALADQLDFKGVVNPKGVKATEEFNKLSTQIVLQQVQQLGGAGTDDKLAAGIKASPSSTLSKMGNKAVIALMLGNEDAITAKNEAWQRWLASGKTPDTYGQFSTLFNRNYDPRVFQAVHMDPEDRAQMFRGMSKAERERYNQALADARAAGWIK